jgi:hypothetical protein
LYFTFFGLVALSQPARLVRMKTADNAAMNDRLFRVFVFGLMAKPLS